MPTIEYGKIKVDLDWRWPTKEIFESWKQDFFKLEETKEFDFYLVGGFNEVLFGNKKHNTPDVDIIIVGEKKIEKIEKLIYEGTRIGLKKYNVFFDILWFDVLPNYTKMKKEETKKVNMCLLSNKWIIDGKIRKQYHSAEQISENLWQMKKQFPTQKQLQRIKDGYNYLEPHKLAY